MSTSSRECERCGTTFCIYEEENINLSKGCILCQECERKPKLAVEPDAVISPNPLLESTVPGLRLIEDFITEEEEINILSELDEDDCSKWTQEMSRRVQVYYWFL